jgi:hypothetical protein
VINVDKNGCYIGAVRDLKRERLLPGKCKRRPSQYWTLNAAPKPSRKPMEVSEDFAQLRLRFTNLIQHSFEVILLLGLLGVAISSSFHRFLLPLRMPKLSTH